VLLLPLRVKLADGRIASIERNAAKLRPEQISW
jgi:hypothetical protein